MTETSFWSEPKWVTKSSIQGIFNECQYYERALRGELKIKLFRYDNHLNQRQRKKCHEPYCTRSQMVLYSTLEGKPVALVYQYKRKDGTIGASGLPDPKRLFIEGKIIAVKQI